MKMKFKLNNNFKQNTFKKETKTKRKIKKIKFNYKKKF
jgi:hypothetical protein